MSIVELEGVRPFKLRLPEDLRRSVYEAAASSNQSINTYVVRRLSESFRAPDVLDQLLTDPALRSLAIMMMTAFRRGAKEAATAQGRPDMSPSEWLDDPFCYRAGASAVGQMLGLLEDPAPRRAR